MQALAQTGNGTAAYIDTANEARKVLVDQLTGALFPIADDVKFQVEWNPAQVAEYRLIGYENRDLADDTEKYGFAEWRRWLNLALESASFVDASVASPVVLTSLPAARGRLFDAASSLTSLCAQASFEGEGPMKLEALAAQTKQTPAQSGPALPLARDDAGIWRTDWSPLLTMLTDMINDDERWSDGFENATNVPARISALLRRVVPVRAGDSAHTLAARVLEQEHVVYPRAVRWFLDERLIVGDGGSVIRLWRWDGFSAAADEPSAAAERLARVLVQRVLDDLDGLDWLVETKQGERDQSAHGGDSPGSSRWMQGNWTPVRAGAAGAGG